MDHLRTQCVLFQMLICAGCLYAFLKEPCRDEISVETCWSFRNKGICQRNQEEMKKVCSKTCGFCDVCEDGYLKEKCEELKAFGMCLDRPIKMRNACPATCGFCPKKCIDIYSGCKMLSRFRTCYEFRERMERYCPETCGYCRAKTPCDNHYCPVGFRCQLKENLEPYCACDVECTHEWMIGPVCAMTGKTYPTMCALKKEECKVNGFIPVDFYGSCNSRVVGCQDANRESAAGLCAKWKDLGSCTNHISLMEVYCKRTCGFCRVPKNPPKRKCLETKYGCCWNGRDIPKKGKYGEGCARCRDLPLCKYFQEYCNSKLSHNFMKVKCPVTCGYCIPQRLMRLKEQLKIAEKRRPRFPWRILTNQKP